MRNSTEIRDFWVQNRKNSPFLIASPAEMELKLTEKTRRTERSTQEGMREGIKSAAIACVASTAITLGAARRIPWVKVNLNYTAQALIISAASVSAFFITADKTILNRAKKNFAEEMGKAA